MFQKRVRNGSPISGNGSSLMTVLGLLGIIGLMARKIRLEYEGAIDHPPSLMLPACNSPCRRRLEKPVGLASL